MDDTYDAFISFSKHDAGWVDTFLLPSLEDARLKVCIPRRDFAIGLPDLVNIERAVRNSRKVLLVLTPSWLLDEYSAFEALLVQSDDPAGVRRRTLPLLLEECALPPRIRTLTAADFRVSAQWPYQTDRVIRAIMESEPHATLSEHVEEALRLYLATNFERDQYARLDQAGESDERSTLLRKVFVDLHVKLRSGPQPQHSMRGGGPHVDSLSAFTQAASNDKPVSAMRLLLGEKQSKLVIIGGPGQGKSTLGNISPKFIGRRCSGSNRKWPGMPLA